MPAARERRIVGGLVVAALALRVALAFVLPPGQAPDEGAHVRYVETVARTGRLPVQPKVSHPHWEQAYQPPLAYLLYVPLWRALEGAGVGADGRLRALRVQNACWGAALVVVGWLAMVRLTPPGDPRRILVALVLALFPGFAGSASVVNNDGLANLAAAALWLVFRRTPRVARGPLGASAGVRTALAAGAVFGVAALAKLTVLVLAPLLVVVPWLRTRDVRSAVRDGVLAGGVAGLLLLPWMARNVALYGNPLAIGVGSISFADFAGILPPEAIATLARPAPSRAFFQYWGVFGVYNNLAWPAVPAVLVPLAAVAVAGAFRPAVGLAAPGLARLMPAFGLALALAVAGLASFSLRYHAAWQGRYLYTVMLPVAVLLATGWARAVPPRWRPAFALALGIGLLVLDASLVLKLASFFARMPPHRWVFGATL